MTIYIITQKSHLPSPCDGETEDMVETADDDNNVVWIGGITEIVKIRYNLDVIPRKAQEN